MGCDPGNIQLPMAFLAPPSWASRGRGRPRRGSYGHRWRLIRTVFHGIDHAYALLVALGGVCVVDVGLVNPEGVVQYKPVLVASYRGDRAAPPLEVRLVADTTQLGRALDGDDGGA